MTKGRISDIFISMQGEGPHLGQQHCFVRLYQCNRSCDYCDTVTDTFTEYSAAELLEAIKAITARVQTRVISFTGGEPLLQRDFLIEALPLLKKAGFTIYLETNGMLFNELFDVIDYLDIIAMDIKLPSSTKEDAVWKEHREFLKIAIEKETFIKTVICLETTSDDFKRAVDLVVSMQKPLTFVLQPNSTQLGRPLADKLQDFKKLSTQYLGDVRVIPQLHKVVGIK